MRHACAILVPLVLGLFFTSPCAAEGLTPDQQAKLAAKVQAFQAWSTDPAVVAAVKAYNANPPAEARTMTNEAWKALTVLDPFVRGLAKNELATHLKSTKDDTVSEIFVSGADGGKVAFLAKTTSWSHKGKAKHDEPMAGKTWQGPAEVDESTGQLQVQIGLPVLDGATPIGSIVIGLSIAKL
ncbi:MAG: hypothetical protein AB1634_09660 [Thermodesulfobacteriota bacterium]